MEHVRGKDVAELKEVAQDAGNGCALSLKVEVISQPCDGFTQVIKIYRVSSLNRRGRWY